MECHDYVGEFCINGLCPKISNSKIKCEECWYNDGCKDCINPYYNLCEGGKDNGNY